MKHIRPHNQSFLIVLLGSLLSIWLSVQIASQYQTESITAQARSSPDNLSVVGQADDHSPETQNQEEQ